MKVLLSRAEKDAYKYVSDAIGKQKKLYNLYDVFI